MPPSESRLSQELINDFWKTRLTPTELPVEALAVLPRNVSSQMLGQQVSRGTGFTTSITTSYEAAKTTCNAKIAQIVKECRRKNQKFSDIHFDLDDTFDSTNTLYAMEHSTSTASSSPSGQSEPSVARLRPPGSVKRIGDIFDNPQFFVDETTAKNIHQGDGATCWFVAALSTMRNCRSGHDLIKRVCVDRDEEVGVYGFLFFRDGEWTSVIVDDKLYLCSLDYDALRDRERDGWEDNRVRLDAVEEYRKLAQTNSRALVYAHSSHPDETWVPLLEKAFAKAHGDYYALTSGIIGNGIEDLTGGTTTKIYTKDILSKNRLWEDGLYKVNDEFLFGCATHSLDDPHIEGRDGIYGDHAYSILRAECYGEERLLMVMNPWGHAEWNGPWSDGSSQWTAEAIKDLGHVFGDDGVFWIRFQDFLRKFEVLYQTRLFTADWNITQLWTRLVVPWAGHYDDLKFKIVIAKTAPAVVVLSQLDDRYFRGLAGQYKFWISFRLFTCGKGDYIISSGEEYVVRRSVSVELELEAGTYEVRPKVLAARYDDKDKVEDVVKSNWLDRREKLLRIGRSYTLAHAKAEPEETEKREEEALSAVTHASVVELAAINDNQALGERKGIEEADGKGVQGGSTTKQEPRKDKKTIREPSEEPWHATCVVGLRVYTKDSNATIQVVDSKKGRVETSKLNADGTPEKAIFSISSIT